MLIYWIVGSFNARMEILFSLAREYKNESNETKVDWAIYFIPNDVCYEFLTESTNRSELQTLQAMSEAMVNFVTVCVPKNQKLTTPDIVYLSE